MTLRSDHEAAVEGRTLFPKTRRDPAPGLLKSGWNSTKLGKTIERGAWKGMPIYSLTLEERATCPRTGRERRNCYGNHMPFAHRFKHGLDLEKRLYPEVAALAKKHPEGFVVRLHVLGDFYSVSYLSAWSAMLRFHSELRIFGYTAHAPDSRMGRYILNVRNEYSGRFQIRFSGVETKTITGQLLKDLQAPNAIVCPAQTGGSMVCATCTLCWSALDKQIAFIAH